MVKITYFKCSHCKNMFPIPRSSGRLRKKHHIKTIWCPFCKKERLMKLSAN